MRAGRERVGQVFAHQECAQRESGGQRLGYGDHIRLYAEMLESKERSGSSQSALNFIEDQHGAGAVRGFAGGAQKFRQAYPDAAFSLNRFHHDGAS